MSFAAMTEESSTGADEQFIIYTIASLGANRWFVDSNKGTSGYSFHSLADAERFAITLAQRNTPSKVCIVGNNGEVMTESVFDQPTATGN
jgi:hypothetical protein